MGIFGTLSRFLLIAAMSLLAAPAARADVMSGSELKLTFAGKTIYLSAPFGSLPIRYSASGTMVAQSRAMQVFAGIYRDTGSWRISGNQFCQRWKTWLKGKEQCFTVRKTGATMHWTSNDGMTGTASAGN